MNRLTFLIASSAIAIAVAFGGASVAAAAPTISLSVGAEPAESITTQLGVSGSSEGDDFAVVRVRPAGGRACAANSEADEGEYVDSSVSAPGGPFSETRNWTFEAAGAYLLCGWLQTRESPSTVVAHASLEFSVRIPHLSLSLSVPASAPMEQTFQVSSTAQAETQRVVSFGALPDTGRGCPANFGAATSTAGFLAIEDGWSVTGGPLTKTWNVQINTPGKYLLCGYFDKSGQTPPEATASASVNIVPPCVVPAFTVGASLGAVEQAIGGTSCVVGRVVFAASRKVHRGGVIRLSAASGTKLAAGTPLTITVSTGPPCVVPSHLTGLSLKAAERKLSAGHCAVGKVRRVASTRYRRGAVVKLSSKSGTTLPSQAAVSVYVSSGRPRHR